MNTKYISENYRKCLLEDEESTAILAYLYWEVPKEEDELRTLFPDINISLKIAELFKSSLIKKATKKHWSISDLGKSIILRSDIVNVILEKQLEGLNKTDKYFLRAAIESQGDKQFHYKNLVTSFIKVLKHSLEHEKLNAKDRQEVYRESLYAYVVGLDSDARAIGMDQYPNYIINRLEDFKDIAKDVRVLLKRSQKTLITRCLKATIDIQKSNGSFIHDDTKSSWKPELLPRAITFARIVSFLINDEMDADCESIFKYQVLFENKDFFNSTVMHDPLYYCHSPHIHLKSNNDNPFIETKFRLKNRSRSFDLMDYRNIDEPTRLNSTDIGLLLRGKDINELSHNELILAIEGILELISKPDTNR